MADQKHNGKEVSLAVSTPENDIDKKDDSIIKELEEAGHELISYAQRIKEKQDERKENRRQIEVNEEQNSRDAEKLKEIRIEIDPLGRQVKQYQDYIAEKKNGLQSVKQEMEGIKSAIKKRSQTINSLEQRIQKLTEERERIAQENENSNENLKAGESVIATEEKEIEKSQTEYKTERAGLHRLIEEEKQLETNITGRNQEITSTQKLIARAIIDRNSLVEEYHTKRLVQAVTPLLIERDGKVEELLSLDSEDAVYTRSPTTEDFLGGAEPSKTIKFDESLRPLEGLEEPFSDLYGGFEYEEFKFIVLDSLAFIKYIEKTAGELSLLSEKSKQSLSNIDESLQWGRTRNEFQKKANKLTKVLDNIISNYNLGLQQKLVSAQENGKENFNYDLNKENLVFDYKSVSPILEILKTLLFSSSNIPNGDTLVDLKTYFAGDGEITPKFDVVETGTEVLNEIKEVCKIAYSQNDPHNSNPDASLKTQIDYLAQLVKIDLTPSQLPPYPKGDKQKE